MADNDMMMALREAVECSLHAIAYEKTQKLKELFENEMDKARSEIVTRIVDQIQMDMQYCEQKREYVIQFRLGGGKNG